MYLYNKIFIYFDFNIQIQTDFNKNVLFQLISLKKQCQLRYIIILKFKQPFKSAFFKISS